MPSVAVIGAGVGGIAMIKSLVEEGLSVTCYEESTVIGGVWNYRKEVQDRPTVMHSTIMNNSKEMGAFSDFPPPDIFPNYMHHTFALKYLEMYAEKFKLKKHVQFFHRVESVERASDYEASGRWDLVVLDLNSGRKLMKTFDAVVVCSGLHNGPSKPKFPGLSNFRGNVIHAVNYKTAEPFVNKRVLIVGIGNSGGDIAVDLSCLAKQVYLSTRSGTWLFGRLALGGYPMDLANYRRSREYLFSFLPYPWLCSYIESMLNKRVDHLMYGILPKHRALSHYPCLNDDLHVKIAQGFVKIRPNVRSFEEQGVRFENESELYEIDNVILATGYDRTYPFLDEIDNPWNGNEPDLYQLVFPPRMTHPTLSFVAMAVPFGPQFPPIEMQTRWIARVLSGNCQLPSTPKMVSWVERNKERCVRRFGKDYVLQNILDWIPYLDGMATHIGVKPNLWWLLLSDPILAIRCFFGPCLPYVYRLQGPHSWKGARDAILGVKERVRRPFQGGTSLEINVKMDKLN